MRKPDLIVIGGGPAGAYAALQAASCGLSVVMVDEQRLPGGQVWRAPATAGAKARPDDPDKRDGNILRDALNVSAVTVISNAIVWSVEPGFKVSLLGDGPMTFEAPRLLAATGASERVVPFEGWTLPGVLGLAAATAIMKAEANLPGQRIVLAGQGPLLVAVAAKALALGIRPIAIVDANGRGDWARAAFGFSKIPSLAVRGMGWQTRVRLAGVPIYRRHGVVEAEGEDALKRVTIAPLDADGRPAKGRRTTLDADILYVGNGLTPNTEVTRLLGAEHAIDPLLGGVHPCCDGFGRTSLSGLYAAGDGAGIRGALPATLSGRLAAIAIAHDSGALDGSRFERLTRPLVRRAKRAAQFADASCALMAVSAERIDAIAPHTVVCRCEDVTRATIDAAAKGGALEINQLKQETRLGMGPCQGRFCSETAAALLGAHCGGRAKAGILTARPPLRPLPIDTMCGTFTYDDIPVPKPAPL
ncbi:MAG: FAD-dependent oxidoreductase [Pseudomonadota bacterium]